MSLIKKIGAMFMAGAMVLGLGVTGVAAEDEGKIIITPNETVTDVADREFTAYQILTATFGEDDNVAYYIPDNESLIAFYDDYFPALNDQGEPMLDDDGQPIGGLAAAEAEGITFDDYVTKKIAELDTAAELQTFIQALSEAIEDETVNGLTPYVSQANGDNAEITGLASGYYLVVDSSNPAEIDPISALMLDTVNGEGEVEIVIKANVPTPDKEIVTAEPLAAATNDDGEYVLPEGYSEEEGYSVGEDGYVYLNDEMVYTDGTTKSNTLGVGQTVNYLVTQYVPNYKGYDRFYYVLNDKLSDGLTFNDDIVVTITHNKQKKTAEVKADGEADAYTLPAAYADSTLYGIDGDGYVIDQETGDRIKVDVLDENGDVIWENSENETVLTLVEGTDYYVYNDITYPADPNDQDSEAYTPTFVLAFANIMQYPVDAKIEVRYSATLNDDAVTGVDPNTNTTNIDYSNNPGVVVNEDLDEDSPHPGVPADRYDEGLGIGPDSVTDTYTTELDIHKVDDAGNPLEGAEFTLTGKSKIITVKDEEYFTASDTAGDDGKLYYMLKNGTYTDAVPHDDYMDVKGIRGNDEVPEGYVIVTEAEYELMSEEEKAACLYCPTSMNGTDKQYFRVVKAEDPSNTVTYDLVHSNLDQYQNTEVTYKKVTATTTSEEEVDVKFVGTTDADGNLVFSGLGEGTYTLEETVVPAGYNKAADITFTITCTLPEDVTTGTEQCTWTVTSVEPADSVAEMTETSGTGDEAVVVHLGIFETTVVNRKGTELPSTGGIGTKLFYAIGGILIAVAGILLVSRKRMLN